jgi:hypothetical protein
MRYLRDGQILLWIALGMSLPAWGQGGSGRAGGRGGGGGADPNAGACERACCYRNPNSARDCAWRYLRAAAGAAERRQAAPQTPSLTTTPTGGLGVGDSRLPARGDAPEDRRQRGLARLHRAGRLPALHNATTGQSEAHMFYTSYFKDGVSDAFGAPAAVLLRRRSGSFGRLAGVRRLRTEAHEVGRRRHRRRSSLWVGGQSRHAARTGRPGVRESRRHGVQPPDQPSHAVSFLDHRRRRRVFGGVRAQFPQYRQSPQFAALSGGRGLSARAASPVSPPISMSTRSRCTAWCCSP